MEQPLGKAVGHTVEIQYRGFFSAGKADDALKVLNSVCDKELGKVLVIDSFLLVDRDDLPEACERVTSVQQFKEYLNTMG